MSITIHWLGAGLSSAPGIRRLAAGPQRLLLWNRTVARAQAVVAELPDPPEVREFDIQQLAQALAEGDILVSMLPAEMHVQLAELALSRGAHFVSSSYVSTEMRALDRQAKQAGLCLVNEVGLDPGLDHLMAHLLVEEFRGSAAATGCDSVSFRSYCGGFPAVANDFRYKFSWSPVGVLRALQSPARSISDGRAVEVAKPWLALTDYRALLPGGAETFQAYPNRDSLPFLDQYHFESVWPVAEFVRGTLRLAGWSEAWRELFPQLDELRGPAGAAALRELGDDLWQHYAYGEDDVDRVVLCVELAAERDGAATWHRGYAIDALGDERGSAMARLVSLPVSLAVDAIVAGQLPAGVSTGPVEPGLIAHWFEQLSGLGEQIYRVNYLEGSLTTA